MFNLWKPLVPPGVDCTGLPIKEVDAGGKVVRPGLVFQRQLSLARDAVLRPIIGLWYWCTDQYIVQRALGAKNETHARRGSIFASLPEAAAGVHLHHSRHHLLRTRQEGQSRGAGDAGRRQRPWPSARESQAAFPLMVIHVLPERRPRHGRGRSARGADELAGRRVQRLVDAVYDRPLQDKWNPEASDSRTGVGRPMATVAMTSSRLSGFR